MRHVRISVFAQGAERIAALSDDTPEHVRAGVHREAAGHVTHATAALNAELARRGLPTLATDPPTEKAVEGHLTAVLGGLLRKEASLPAYRGMKPDEIAAELNRVRDPGVRDQKEGKPPRINDLFAGIPYAPNVVTAEDVAAALSSSP